MGDLTGIIEFIILVVFLGALVWWFNQAPIDGVIKQWGYWLLIGVAIFVVVKIGLPLLGLHVL